MQWYCKVSLDIAYRYPPADKSLAGMLAVFAQFEREILRGRVKDLLSQGYSKSKIARELGIERTSVRRILNNLSHFYLRYLSYYRIFAME